MDRRGQPRPPTAKEAFRAGLSACLGVFWVYLALAGLAAVAGIVTMGGKGLRMAGGLVAAGLAMVLFGAVLAAAVAAFRNLWLRAPLRRPAQPESQARRKTPAKRPANVVEMRRQLPDKGKVVEFRPRQNRK